MLVGTLLITTVGAHALLRIAPESYADSAPLIPIIAAGLVAPTVFRMINKSVKYADKRVPFIIGAVCAAFLFVGLSLLLVPPLGVIGTPLAMIGAFAPPAAFVFYRSQRGRSPIRMPWRMIFVSTIAAFAVGAVHGLIPLEGLFAQTLLGIVAVAIWCALVLAFGGVPRAHRAPLWMMFKGLRPQNRDFDGTTALEALSPRERRALRRAIKRDMKPRKAAKVLGNNPINEPRAGPEAILVHLLRRAAEGGGVKGLPAGYGERSRPRKDEQIGRYLFARGTIAERDQMGKKLVNDGVTDAFDLHTLETVLTRLKAMPGPSWGAGSSN